MNEPATHLIVLPAFPIELFLESRRHNEALVREFMFIVEAEPGGTGIPSRLLTLGRQIRDRFYGLNATMEAQMDSALERGETTIDLEVRVSVHGREAAITLAALFDEADAFCRNGDLLTLAESSDMRAFRTWYIEECVRQLDGGPPTSWPEWQVRRATTRS